MKKIATTLLVLLVASVICGQRFLPLMNETDHIGSLINYNNQEVHCFEVFQNDLYIGGDFTSQMGVGCVNLARWDGQQLSAVPEASLPANIFGTYDLVVWNDQLIIATGARGDSAVVAWNGTETTPMNMPISSLYCRKLIVFENSLYGAFSGDAAFRGIYRYEENTWNQIAYTLVSELFDFASSGNELWFVSDERLYQMVEDEPIEFGYELTYEAEYLSFTNGQLLASGTFYRPDSSIFHIARILNDELVEWPVPQVQEISLAKVFYTEEWEGYLIGRANAWNFNYSMLLHENGDFTLLPVHIKDVIEFEETLVAHLQTDNGTLDIASYFQPSGLYTLHSGIHETELNHGELSTTIGATSIFSYHPQTDDGMHHVYDDHNTTIYSGIPWVYGISQGDTMVCATLYDLPFGFADGPVCDVSDKSFLIRYDRVWAVSRDEIEEHIASFMLPDYQPPSGIAEWPAHGLSSNGEASHLAPFVDTNGNGVYEPVLGDYPEVPGDQNVFALFHDSPLLPNAPDAAMKIELHLCYYTLDDTTAALRNTLFLQAKLINRGEVAFDSLAFGYWADADIGNPNDDHVGCDPELSYFYTYNGDEFDEPTSMSAGYAAHPPAQGIAFLSHPLAAHVMLTTNQSNPTTGPPQNQVDFIHYMSGRWKDGQPMTYGGSGLNTPWNDPPVVTPFYMSDYPWDPEGQNWNQLAMGYAPFDVRSVGSIAPEYLGPDESMCVTLAFVSAQDTLATEVPHVASLELLKEYVATLQTLAENVITCFSTGTATVEGNGTESDDWFQVYPNPGNEQLTISIPLDENTYPVRIYDDVGRLVYSAAISGGPYIKIPTEDFARTFYMVTLQKEDRILSRKWIKL